MNFYWADTEIVNCLALIFSKLLWPAPPASGSIRTVFLREDPAWRNPHHKRHRQNSRSWRVTANSEVTPKTGSVRFWRRSAHDQRGRLRPIGGRGRWTVSAFSKPHSINFPHPGGFGRQLIIPFYRKLAQCRMATCPINQPQFNSSSTRRPSARALQIWNSISRRWQRTAGRHLAPPACADHRYYCLGMARFSRCSGLMRWSWSARPRSICTHDLSVKYAGLGL